MALSALTGTPCVKEDAERALGLSWLPPLPISAFVCQNFCVPLSVINHSWTSCRIVMPLSYVKCPYMPFNSFVTFRNPKHMLSKCEKNMEIFFWWAKSVISCLHRANFGVKLPIYVIMLRGGTKYKKEEKTGWLIPPPLQRGTLNSKLNFWFKIHSRTF